jgi:molecular chaperone IbpA
MRSTVGFDRFNDLFESLLNEDDGRFDNYPPYNIEKLNDDEYRITMAVAGFSMDDLNIVAQEDRLSVEARVTEKDDNDVQYLHRGIAKRAFERSFRLADHIQVTDASMDNGLLSINLVREVPEEKKPRLIQINGGGIKELTGKKKK